MAVIEFTINVDVNETAVDLDVALKMLCLSPPLCKCYKGVCDNQTRDEHGMTLSDLDDNEDNNE